MAIASKQLAAAPNEHHSYYTIRSDGLPAEFLPTGPDVHTVKQNAISTAALVRRAREADVIIAHGMTPHAAAAIAATGGHTVVIWSGWGYDYYGSSRDPFEGQLTEATKRLLATTNHRRVSPHRVRRFARQRLAEHLFQRAAARADFFSAPIPTDFEVFVHRYPEFRGQYLQLRYGDTQSLFNMGPVRQDASAVLVGNSATPTNNHLDVFEILANLKRLPDEVLVPLSYGYDDYRVEVLREGRRILGSRFRPILDHLPLADYHALMRRCGHVVMNSIRQQALGNVGAALHGGAQVYLNDSGSLYSFLRSLGVYVRSVASLAEGEELSSAPPAPSLVEWNRMRLDQFWSAERTSESLSEMRRLVTRHLGLVT